MEQPVQVLEGARTSGDWHPITVCWDTPIHYAAPPKRPNLYLFARHVLPAHEQPLCSFTADGSFRVASFTADGSLLLATCG